MAKKIRLVWQCNFNVTIQYHTLATQAGINARVNRSIYKILFFLRYLLDVIHTLIYINMAGTAPANSAAIVLQINTILEAYI